MIPSANNLRSTLGLTKASSWVAAFLCSCLLFSSCRSQEPCPSEKLQPHPQELLRVALSDGPHTLDPRLTNDPSTLALLHLLYEGLTRLNEEGKPVLALARSIDTSPDGKIYTVKLRESYWNNGDKVIAQDFAYGWKSMLHPLFETTNAEQLYPLRLARRAREGDAFVDAVGIDALDQETLVIELEEPLPDFLKRLASPFFYPVNSRWIQQQDWQAKEKEGVRPQEIPTNGPFSLRQWERGELLKLVKNDHYWDEKAVLLDQVELIYSDPESSLKLFELDELDWVGSPFSSIPSDQLGSLRDRGCINQSAAALIVEFLRFNTKRPPLNNEKLRQALSLAIDRKEIVDKVLHGGQLPATGFVPTQFALQPTPLLPEQGDRSKAWLLFKQAMQEMGMTSQELPSLRLCYAPRTEEEAMAQLIKEQWQRQLQIEVTLLPCSEKPWPNESDISFGSWRAQVEDPLAFLSLFAYRDEMTNSTGWSHKGYRELLQQAAATVSAEERQKLLAQAEVDLLVAMPIAPLFQSRYNAMAKRRVEQAWISPLGYLELKEAGLRHYTIDFQEAPKEKPIEETAPTPFLDRRP